MFDFDDTLPPHRPLPLVFVLRRTFSHQQSLADERLEHNVGLVCFNSSFDSEIGTGGCPPDCRYGYIGHVVNLLVAGHT